jgi:ribonuclease P protein component
LSRQFGYRREQRLGKRDVALVLASGRRFKLDALLVQIRENGLDLARLGLIVPKRYLPSSVDRNLVKRKAREWFRTRQNTFMGKDVLVRLTGPRQGLSLVADDLARLSV